MTLLRRLNIYGRLKDGEYGIWDVRVLATFVIADVLTLLIAANWYSWGQFLLP